MPKPERLREFSENLQRKAAELAQAITAELMRPTTERAPIGTVLDELENLQLETANMVSQLRRALGKDARDAPRPFKRVLTDGQYLKVMRARLRLWARVTEAARSCTDRLEWPLVPDPRPRLDLGAAQESVLVSVFTMAHRAVNPVPQAPDAAELGCFPDIPLNVGRFLANVHLAHRLLLARKHAGVTRFLDVGCGGGIKVTLAAELFDVADGLEYDPGYVETAERTFQAMRARRCSVFQADGLSFEGYGDYEVIYFFQPMSSSEGLYRLEERIVDSVPAGTILIAPYDGFVLRALSLDCLRVAASVFIKGIGEDELEGLVAETRRMGPHIVNPEMGIPSETGWLRPLWLACEANGIRPG